MLEDLLTQIMTWFLDVLRRWFARDEAAEALTELSYWMQVDA